MSVDVLTLVWRELDQIRAAGQQQAEALERTLARIDERDEERDREVSDLRLQVNLLRSECKRNIKRDAGLVLAPTTLTALITAVLNWTTQPPPAPPALPAPSAIAAPAAPTGG